MTLFRKKYRVVQHYSPDPFTSFPNNKFVVEVRKNFKWETIPDLEPFDTRADAHAEAERRAKS